MAAVTTSPPPPPQAQSPHALPGRPHWNDDAEGDTSAGLESQVDLESPRIRDAPLSPVRLTFHPENWAQPTNVNIEHSQHHGLQAATIHGGPNLDKPLPMPIERDLPLRSTESNSMSSATVREYSLDHRSEHGIDGNGHGPEGLPKDALPGQDRSRQSRDTDLTGSSQQLGSVESSIGTNSSSVSQDPSENQTISDQTSQEGSSLEGGIPGNQSVPQLQYHHQSILPRTSSVPLESEGVRQSPVPDNADHGRAINRHLTPNSFYGRRSSMPRPQSAYSAYSDRGQSPQMRVPSGQARKSPDTRSSSYAELLNVPYPQPAPAPITFDNSQLRNNVGTNASLLSAEKTLEMYRQNVKKTNDFSIQYSFAVFLISTAQELGPTLEEPSRKKSKGAAEGADAEAARSSPAALIREAKSILTKLSNGGYPFAQYYLADGYASGLFNKGKEDYNSAFPLFVLAAKHGHAESAYRAGLCYEFGWGCRKDPAKAVQFLRTAASRNHPGAMTRLGKACLSGDLGENRYREGIKWLKRATEAADHMYNAAPYHLGCLYETGYGDDIFKDESYAAELFTQAAELGHPEASFRMGEAYEHGLLNCPRDPALSVHFYTGAAEGGHAGGMMGLCAWYMVGAEPILEKDEEEAYEWARRSAELGFVKAMYAVGYFTEMGIGCRRDILEANVWYVKAADAGDERATQRLAAIRAAISGGTPMEVGPPRNGKMKKAGSKDDKDCTVM